MEKYMDLLKKAKEQEINVIELFIADNVVCDVMNSINYDLKDTQEINDLIERICEDVKWFYFKCDGLSISDISRAYCELHFDDLIPLEKITKTMIYDRVNSYYI